MMQSGEKGTELPLRERQTQGYPEKRVRWGIFMDKSIFTLNR
jgi:hypothetical protein